MNVPTSAAATAPATSASAGAGELEWVDGIGPAYNRILAQHGIVTNTDLANTTVAQLKATGIARESDEEFASWINQARHKLGLAERQGELEWVDGIGPSYNQILARHGIVTNTDLANATVAQLKATGITRESDEEYGRWIAQARQKVGLPNKDEGLEWVDGIGPTYNQILAQHGIHNNTDLANATVAQLKATGITRESDEEFASWINQARHKLGWASGGSGLEWVDGIGPTYNQILAQHGIHTDADLANATVAQLKATGITRESDEEFASWIAQAQRKLGRS